MARWVRSGDYLAEGEGREKAEGRDEPSEVVMFFEGLRSRGERAWRGSNRPQLR
jgi:hypothetical protein